MLKATLGGLIKDYRIKKRLTQLDVSLHIGWKDTTRLSKIEQGRVGKPTRKTIEKIMESLKLTDQEKGEFLYMGGYIPTDAEVKKIVRIISLKLDHWPYPAYLMDFSWRFLYTNTLNLKVFNMDLAWQKKTIKLKPNVLMFPFLAKDQVPVTVEKGEDKNKLKPFAVAQIAAFKTETHQFQNEGWYNKLIQQLMSFEEFRKLWPKISLKDYYKKLYDYEYKRISGVYRRKKRALDFHIFTAKVINDPRFQEVLYFPANKKTEIFCAKLR